MLPAFDVSVQSFISKRKYKNKSNYGSGSTVQDFIKKEYASNIENT